MTKTTHGVAYMLIHLKVYHVLLLLLLLYKVREGGRRCLLWGGSKSFNKSVLLVVVLHCNENDSEEMCELVVMVGHEKN